MVAGFPSKTFGWLGAAVAGAYSTVRPIFFLSEEAHSDSLDTLLYARFDHSEPRVLWMETKKSWMGTFPWSHDHDSCTMAFGNPLLYVREKKNFEKPFPPWVRAVSKIYNSIGEFTIPLEVCILMRRIQWALWSVTSSRSECRSDQRCAAKLSAWWAAKRRLISNDRHGVIPLSILANKPSSFS